MKPKAVEALTQGYSANSTFLVLLLQCQWRGGQAAECVGVVVRERVKRKEEREREKEREDQ